MKPLQYKKPSKIPLLLSVFICPGAGQLFQQRWVVGALFLIGFLSGFFWLILLALSVIIDFYRFGLEFNTYDPEPVAVTSFIAPLAFATVIYIGNLFDIAIAQIRIAHIKREEALVHFLNDSKN